MDTTTEITTLYGRRKKRSHSPEFKAAMVAACQQPGVSMAAVALAHGLNANVLRRWVVQSESGGMPVNTDAKLPPTAFMALSLPPRTSVSQDGDIRIELNHGAAVIKLQWPASAAQACGHWLSELLRSRP